MPPRLFGFGTRWCWALLLVAGDGVFMYSEGGMPQYIDTLGGRGYP
jgi:hypothetical protein